MSPDSVHMHLWMPQSLGPWAIDLHPTVRVSLGGIGRARDMPAARDHRPMSARPSLDIHNLAAREPRVLLLLLLLLENIVQLAAVILAFTTNLGCPLLLSHLPHRRPHRLSHPARAL